MSPATMLSIPSLDSDEFIPADIGAPPAGGCLCASKQAGWIFVDRNTAQFPAHKKAKVIRTNRPWLFLFILFVCQQAFFCMTSLTE